MRGDSPSFSLLVSDSGHLEVSICLKFPVSENISVLWPAGMYPGTDLGSSRAGEKILQPTTWRGSCSPRPEGRESDKGKSPKLAFQTLTEKHALLKEVLPASCHRATWRNISLMKRKKETSLEAVNIILFLPRLILRL